MALRNMTLYSIFVRNFGGSFSAVEREIPRLKSLGIDAVWLLPIHPIGKEKRKGSLGSPYAISDYRAVNPELGTLEDFIALCDTVHKNGMKILIDVVYHHTSPDSVLVQTHPEYFYRKPDGSFGNHVGDWTDIIDLDFDVPALWDELIDTLCYWAQYVDGFRCDVAPLVPLEFWKEARRRVAAVFGRGKRTLLSLARPAAARSARGHGQNRYGKTQKQNQNVSDPRFSHNSNPPERNGTTAQTLTRLRRRTIRSGRAECRLRRRLRL